MKLITYAPHELSVFLDENGWNIQCITPSPLADLFNAITPTEQISTVMQAGNTYNNYPVTAQLDEHIKSIIDMLTAVRYETNRIQLPLFTDNLFED